jgi:predicted RNA-binding Zn ribbon-like protein
VSYFFFEYNARDGFPPPRDFAYRAILAQLLHRFQKDEDILEVFSFALTNRRDGQTRATPDELLELIRALATRIDRWFIVIDAVEECDESDTLILELNKALGDRPTKLLLFSRPNVRFLRQKMKQPQILMINRSSVAADLRLYFNTHLQRLQDLGIIPSHACREELVENLLTGADRMFQ